MKNENPLECGNHCHANEEHIFIKAGGGGRCEEARCNTKWARSATGRKREEEQDPNN